MNYTVLGGKILNNIFYNFIGDYEFTGDIEADTHNILIKNDRHVIAEHTIRVAKKAFEIAEEFGVDKTSARIAGFLHDISGIIPNDKRLEAANLLNIDVLPEEERLPLILHQKISRVMAQDVFGINDTYILNAIECHTTLKANASKLDMVLFIADKIEWDQKGIPPYIKEVNKGLDISLEYAAFSYLKFQWDNRANLKVLHPWLEEAYKDLYNRVNMMDK